MARDQIDHGNPDAAEAATSSPLTAGDARPDRSGANRAPVARTLIGAGVLAGCLAAAGCNPTTKTSAIEPSDKVTVASVDARKNARGPVVGKPYKVANRWYTPAHDPHYKAVGVASWYGLELHGRMTASGETFDSTSISVAHPTLPLPSYVRVTNLKNGRSIVARVNDRGPFSRRRLVDVSERVASMLDFKRSGSARVSVEYVGEAPVGVDDTDRLLATYSEPNKPGRALPETGERNMMLASAGPTAVYSIQQGLEKLQTMMPVLAQRPEPVTPPPASLPDVSQMTIAGLATPLPEERPGTAVQVASAGLPAAPQPAAAAVLAAQPAVAAATTARRSATARPAEAAMLASAPAAVPVAQPVAEVAVLESGDPDMPPVRPGTVISAAAAPAEVAAVEPVAYSARAHASDPAQAAARVANTAPLAASYVYTPFVPATGAPMQLAVPATAVGDGSATATSLTATALSAPEMTVPLPLPSPNSVSMLGTVTPSSSSFAPAVGGSAAMEAASRFGALSVSASWRKPAAQ